jgi:monoamine oxidase
LPSSYKTAIEKIGFGVFNKVIVTFKQPFWKTGRKILNFIANEIRYQTYQECYVVSESPKSNLVMFLVGGSRSSNANKMSNSRLINHLVDSLSKIISTPI